MQVVRFNFAWRYLKKQQRQGNNEIQVLWNLKFSPKECLYQQENQNATGNI